MPGAGVKPHSNVKTAEVVTDIWRKSYTWRGVQNQRLRFGEFIAAVALTLQKRTWFVQ